LSLNFTSDLFQIYTTDNTNMAAKLEGIRTDPVGWHRDSQHWHQVWWVLL